MRNHLDACLDLYMLEGAEELRMHQLRAGFLRDAEGRFEDASALKRLREVQSRRLVEVAGMVAENPADADMAKILKLFPVSPQRWEGVGSEISAAGGESVGRALYEIGRFEEARPWYERAVAEKEKGDVHGRIDHASLGRSLHQVGICLSSMGRFEEARPWFERAVEAMRKGDLHGSVDHKNLALSLRAGAACLRQLGETRQADEWSLEASRIDP
ncbi:MAG: tetratricopeptide repeat protein [Acidobacteria bacterium]|nr:tetratricopeptide repeat protein [Acidobacteriota bacterium]